MSDAHAKEWHSDSHAEDGIWRAIEAVSTRQTFHEDEDREFQRSLPRLLADAVATGIREVVSDHEQRDAFWRSGVDHVGRMMRDQAGGTVLGLLWGALKIIAVFMLVLIVVGVVPAKALLAAWWKS